ncbi:MAG: hypothetical protein IJ711_02585 [Lachnospiraceae bacterium]|nr:hypothetical protein [Lachnospiraceae bacterium]
MAERTWISFTDGESGQPAEKTVRYANTESGADDAGSAFVSIRYQMDGVWQITEPYDQVGTVLFDLAEAGTTSEPGGPMLVREGLYVAVPQGKRFKRLEVVNVRETNLEGTYDVLPVPEPVLETEEQQFVRNDAAYSSDRSYPSGYAEFLGQEQVLGTECMLLYVYPMHYRPASGVVSIAEQMEIKVWFEDEEPSLRKSPEDALPHGLNEALYPLLLGYRELYQTDAVKKPKMLIITTEELEYSMKIYEGVKTFAYDVEIVLTKDIYAKYSDKSQDEAILAYLMQRYASDGISYVVLGGDINQIPTHRDSEGFASDSYYCTDGKTVLPRFALSRFPARSREELNRQTDIASYYDRFYRENIRHTAVFTTFNKSNYEQCKEDIAANVTANSTFRVEKKYDGKCKKSELVSAINQGAAFVNYRGHGSNTSWSASIGLSTRDVPKLDVKRNTPIVLSIACNNNNLYVDECFGACWVRKEKAVAFLGASNPSYTRINHYYDKYLWEAIYGQKLSVIGDIYVWATLKLYQNYADYYSKKNIREYLLLGDVSADYLADDKTHKTKTEE